MPRKHKASRLLHPSPALDSPALDPPAQLSNPDAMDTSEGPNFQLATEETCSRLNQIDKLRALGVGGCVSLPQLVVCGDQSTGKSSILERLSGISFPRKDGLCTRFATEIVLRHSNTPLEVVVTIRPHASRDATSRSALESFKKTFSTLDSMHLPDIIEEAGSLMGLRGYGADEGKAFSLDLLHIRVTGSTSLHLTIVDLPGLIAVQNDEQTQDDVNTVHSLADTYLKSPRTIILAVIQAGNDIANQSVVQKAKTHDPAGIRTVGIITKPDLVNPGTESRIVQLANNEGNVRLNLGFFLLKNLAPNNTMPADSLGPRPEKVNKKERWFFKQPAWEGLDPDRIGITNMKKFLRNLLQDHIEREIPSIKDELRKKLAHVESEYQALGKPRQTAQDIRTFLIERNMALHQLVQNALSGSYLSDSAFFSDNTRLRAMIHQENMAFAEEMRTSGGKRKITSSSSQGPDSSNQTPATIKSATEEVDAEQGQLRVTHHQMMDWVKEVHSRTRGLELSGNFNHGLFAELHRCQASRWITIAETHLGKVQAMTQSWLRQAVNTTIHDEDLRPSIVARCLDSHKALDSSAREELRKIWEDEQRPPLTYNHYYTDNVQKARLDVQSRALWKAVDRAQPDPPGRNYSYGSGGDPNEIVAAFERNITVNMDNHACEDALAAMQAYYKVALKTFVDNVCKQVIERHILAPLPAIFSPAAISELSEEELLRIGREPAKKQGARQRLAARAEIMRKGLLELEKNM